ncbi:hypothetical protein MUP32_04415 [Candidatus Microgenomates bacterium]|nr:hypothetical protein [Candidatus Microgenomates bacterium]
MRKSTAYSESERKIRDIIQEEIKQTNGKISLLGTSMEILSLRVVALSEKADLFDKHLVNFKDQIITLLDKVLLELQTIREEKTVVAGKLSEHSDILEDHETRIGKVEQVILP